jgi:ABC-type glycerol-3-phosphate transport system permease component
MDAAQRRHPLTTAGLYVALTGYFIVGLIPFAWLLLTSLKKPADVIAALLRLVFTPTLENYQAVLFNTYTADSVLGKVRADIPHAFLNSLLIAGGATLLALVLGNFAAIALALRAPGARILRVLLPRLPLLPGVRVHYPDVSHLSAAQALQHARRIGSHVSAACRAAHRLGDAVLL